MKFNVFQKGLSGLAVHLPACDEAVRVCCVQLGVKWAVESDATTSDRDVDCRSPRQAKRDINNLREGTGDGRVAPEELGLAAVEHDAGR